MAYGPKTLPPLRIFVVHASDAPTDHLPHGDGLLAYRYITELAERGHQLVVATEGSAIAGKIPSQIQLVQLNHRTKKNRFAYMREVRSLFMSLHRSRPFDIVHQLNPVFIGLSLALAGTQPPLVLGPYVPSWPHSNRNKAKALVSSTLRWMEQSQAKAVILANRQAEEKRRFKFVKSYLVPYGLDTKSFPFHPLPNGRPTIVFLGPIADRKGIIPLIHALNLLRKQVPSVLLRIAGRGEREETMRTLINQLNLEENVEFLGPVPRPQVPSYLASGHLLCQPSLGEPYGMSIVEAMAIGRPIVATAAGGFLDTVSPEGGILVPTNDPSTLANAMAQILLDPSKMQNMSLFNTQKANTYDWSSIIDQIEAIYAEATAK